MNQNLIIIFVTFLATVVTFFVSGKVSEFETRDVILVVTSFISISAIILGFMAFYRAEKNQSLINENIEKLSDIKESYEKLVTHQKIEWLLNDDQLLTVEQLKRCCKEIWIVSPDPADDTGDSPWTAVIKQNIQDGISYYYISPKSPSLDGAIKGLKTIFRDNLDQCMIVKLKPSDYEKLPHEHLVIYDPHNDHGESDSFAEIDTEEKGWWVKLPVSRQNIIVGKLLPLIKDSKTLGDI